MVRLGVAVFIGGVIPSATSAQAARDTLRLRDAIALAAAANPGVRAAALAADAARERIGPAGAWMDPQLAVGLMNRPVGGFGTDEPMTMNTVQVSQMLPWPGKLGFAKTEARHRAEASAFSAEAVAVATVGRLRQVYYEVAYIDRALEVMRATQGLLRDFLDVSQTMYAVGETVQQDVLQAQVSVARMAEDIIVMSQRRTAMAARLNALMGRDAGAVVDAVELSSIDEPLPTVDALLAIAMERRPGLLAARARVDAAHAGYRATRRELYPDIMLAVTYGQRPQFDDMATFMVGFSIPLWAGSRQLPMRRAMAAMEASEEAMVVDLVNETYAELIELRAVAERARTLSRLYGSSILPQARAAVEAAMSAYRVGQVNYMTLAESQMTVNRYEIERIRLTAEYHQTVAAVDVVLGMNGVEP